MRKSTFDILLLIARPAAGKSEIIKHLRHTPLAERRQRYHIGQMVEIDDFPMIWTWFEEDAILSRWGYPRLHTDEDQHFIADYMWDLLVERISVEYQKMIAEDPGFHNHKTTIIEFARGTEHGGYAQALKHLSQDILEKLAVMYVQVSWEESLRKNRIRYNPDRPYSILEHALPDHRLQRLYRSDDWEAISAPDPDFLTIQGIQVPYVVFDNEDDLTTAGGQALSQRLETHLNALWALYHSD